MKINKLLTFSSFRTGPENRFAKAAAESVVDGSVLQFDLLYLYGDLHLIEHLMHAIANKALLKDPDTVLFLVSASELFEAASQPAKRSLYLDAYEKADYFLIFGLDEIPGASAGSESAAVINNILLGGRKVVIGSSFPPNKINGLTREYAQLLNSGLCVDVLKK